MMGAEVNLEKLKFLSVEETRSYILSEIEKFNKTKYIKDYLRKCILVLEEDIKLSLSNYTNFSTKKRIKELEHTKKSISKIKVINKIYKEYKNINDKKIIKNEVMVENVKTLSGNLDSYGLKKIIEVLKELILKSDILIERENIEIYSLYIKNIILENVDEYDKNEIGSILDSLKYRLSKLEADSEEKRVLKVVQKDFKKLNKILNVDKRIKTKEDSYIEIIDYYIQNESLFAIYELIRRKPEVCNLKVNNEHIVFHLIDLYYKNLMLMFEDKHSNYINPHYIEELYLTFTRSVHFRMNNADKLKIEERLNEISSFVSNTLVKEKRKKYALNEIKCMRTDRFYEGTLKEDEIDINDDYITYVKQTIINNNTHRSKKIEDNGVLPESAFVVGDTAYTINDLGDKIILKIHTLNCSSFITRDSFMNRYFYQCVCNDVDVDDYITRGFKFDEGSNYYTMTYNLEFTHNGKFKNLTVTRNFINIKKVYHTFYNKDLFVEQFEKLYLKSINKNGGTYVMEDILLKNKHFENILNIAYPKFLKDNNLPFIYHGYTKITAEELEENRNFLSKPLSTFSKSESSEMLDILTSRIDKYHYSVYPIPNPVYDLKLIHNFNYLGMENLRMLNELYFNSCKVDKDRIEKKKKIYLTKYDKLVYEFNKNIDYVDNEKIKRYKGRMITKQF